MSAIELALWHIRDEVLRGDTIESIMSRQGGSGGPGYDVTVGGHMFSPEQQVKFGTSHKWSDDDQYFEDIGDPIKRIPTSKILVSEAQGKYVNEVFSLAELFRIIKKESKQLTLFV